MPLAPPARPSVSPDGMSGAGPTPNSSDEPTVAAPAPISPSGPPRPRPVVRTSEAVEAPPPRADSPLPPPNQPLGETQTSRPLPRLALAPLEPAELLYERLHEPSDESPILYRERAYLVDALQTDDDLEEHLEAELSRIRRDWRHRDASQFVQLSLFDHRFHGEPVLPPIATLSWKDWQGRSEIWVRGVRRSTMPPGVPIESFPPIPRPDRLAAAERHSIRAAREVSRAELESIAPPAASMAPESLDPEDFASASEASSARELESIARESHEFESIAPTRGSREFRSMAPEPESLSSEDVVSARDSSESGELESLAAARGWGGLGPAQPSGEIESMLSGRELHGLESMAPAPESLSPDEVTSVRESRELESIAPPRESSGFESLAPARGPRVPDALAFESLAREPSAPAPDSPAPESPAPESFEETLEVLEESDPIPLIARVAAGAETDADAIEDAPSSTEQITIPESSDADLEPQPDAPPAAAGDSRPPESGPAWQSPHRSGEYLIPIPDELAQGPSSQRVLASEELIGSLFERMHELAFAPTVNAGADYVLGALAEYISCDGALIHVLDVDTDEFVVMRALGPDSLEVLTHRTPALGSHLSDCLRRRATLELGQGDIIRSRNYWQTLGVIPRHVIASPIRRKDKSLGVIELGRVTSKGSFNPGQVRALQYVCEQFAEFVADRPIDLARASLYPHSSPP